MRQSDLARLCGISPSYLNLIEHNRRRIGGKLLVDIARALSVDSSQLSEGAGSAVVGALRAAASVHPAASAEIDRAEEFASRLPGWAALVAAQADRIAALERTVEALSDRLTHDPYLSASLHDVLSVVTAIRSTSAILVDEGEIPADWQARFHRNLYEDSRRLAEASRALVGYLDAGADTSRGIGTPEDEVDAFLAARDFHFEELEHESPADTASILAPAKGLTSAAGRAMAARYLDRYREDARRVPLDPLCEVVERDGPDPEAVAARFGVDLPTVFRRLASLPSRVAGRSLGLVACDGSGTLIHRKPIEGFQVPRFGAACPLWPLYEALSHPMSALRQVVEQPGEPGRRYVTYAVCEPVRPAGFDLPAVIEATMLVVPVDGGAGSDRPRPIGTSCRICPRTACPARRDPSVLASRGGPGDGEATVHRF
jgi:transcriptional regulator with XRE-family HTH domain